MDESVDMFHADQKRLAEQGGPARAFIGQVKDSVISLAAWALVMLVVRECLSATPRNADHSLKLVDYGPLLAIMALGSAVLLRKTTFRKSPLALAAWMLISFALVAIPAGALDMLSRNGS